MNADEHIAEAEKLLALYDPFIDQLRGDLGKMRPATLEGVQSLIASTLAAAQAHATVALALNQRPAPIVVNTNGPMTLQELDALQRRLDSSVAGCAPQVPPLRDPQHPATAQTPKE